MFSNTSVLGRVARMPLRLLPATLVVPVLHGPLRGSKWIVGSAHHACWLGSYEYEKQRSVAAALKSGSVFYDVGANAGLYSMLAARLVGPGKVYAFEPLAENIAYLKRHIQLNGIRNVEVLELAISDAVGAALFFKSADNSMGHLTKYGKTSVQTATLDFLVSEGRILPPDFIKMDIEGAELQALHGAQGCLQKYHPMMFLATHGRDVHVECGQLLTSWGYACRPLEAFCDDRGEIIAEFPS